MTNRYDELGHQARQAVDQLVNALAAPGLGDDLEHRARWDELLVHLEAATTRVREAAQDQIPECEACGYRDDGHGIRALRHDGDIMLCDFCRP
jgi:hypothetical protein|tara:strand:- start:10 stop:288 length:279 start_codon:yes stop_codon:yes gene_type:complete